MREASGIPPVFFARPSRKRVSGALKASSVCRPLLRAFSCSPESRLEAPVVVAPRERVAHHEIDPYRRRSACDHIEWANWNDGCPAAAGWLDCNDCAIVQYAPYCSYDHHDLIVESDRECAVGKLYRLAALDLHHVNSDRKGHVQVDQQAVEVSYKNARQSYVGRVEPAGRSVVVIIIVVIVIAQHIIRSSSS